MRWSHNRLHLVLVLIFDVLALATWSLPAAVIGASLTGWLVFRIWQWNTRRFAHPA
jgi:chromate transport protein ChrA